MKKYSKDQIKESLRYWKKMLNEWNDTHLPRPRVGRHETSIPDKYWVAIEEYSEKLSNVGNYLNSNLQKIPVAHNNTPPSTTDINKAYELAHRALGKYSNFYILIGKDTTSKGMQTQKNHLSGGSIIDCWIPDMQYWRNGGKPYSLSEEDNIQESEYIKPYCYDTEYERPIMTVGDLKRILSNFKDSDSLIMCNEEGDPSYKVTSVWNSNYEFEMTGIDAGDDSCYIRIG